MHNAYKNWIINSYNQIQTEYVELNKLDQIVGDGDHGSTILKGLKIAKDLYLNNMDSAIDDSMAIVSKRMRIEMGGASGILMSIFFDESGKISESNLNQSMIDIFSKSIDKIMNRGKVKAGDKSILDIYVPVLEFLKQNSDSKIQKDEINEILSLSLSKTKDMKAQVGRAKFLENRGLGCIDPGARSTEIILREFFDSVL